MSQAPNQLGSLYGSAVSLGFDPGSISVQALGDAAVVAAVGGELNIDAKTGDISAKVSQPGSRLKRRITIGTLSPEENQN